MGGIPAVAAAPAAVSAVNSARVAAYTTLESLDRLGERRWDASKQAEALSPETLAALQVCLWDVSTSVCALVSPASSPVLPSRDRSFKGWPPGAGSVRPVYRPLRLARTCDLIFFFFFAALRTGDFISFLFLVLFAVGNIF